MSKKDKTEIIKRLDIGVLGRDASGRLTYEIYDFPSELYKSKKKELAKKFGLIPFGITIYGLDEAFQTFIKGFKRIGIEWDNWSGFIIVAKNKRSENLVKEIGQYLEETVKVFDNVRWIERGDLKFRIKKNNDEQSIVWTTKQGIDVNFAIMMYEFFDYCRNEFDIRIIGDNSWIFKGYKISNDDINIILSEIEIFVDEWNIQPLGIEERISEEEWYSVS